VFIKRVGATVAFNSRGAIVCRKIVRRVRVIHSVVLNQRKGFRQSRYHLSYSLV
jgi:hypothetical protein